MKPKAQIKDERITGAVLVEAYDYKKNEKRMAAGPSYRPCLLAMLVRTLKELM